MAVEADLPAGVTRTALGSRAVRGVRSACLTEYRKAFWGRCWRRRRRLRSEVAGAGAAQMERIAFALHEMCQPLMTLQCRLEIGKMVGTADGYEEAVREGLAECERLLRSVDVLRQRGCAGAGGERSS